jgi:hypothetical protein
MLHSLLLWIGAARALTTSDPVTRAKDTNTILRVTLAQERDPGHETYIDSTPRFHL